MTLFRESMGGDMIVEVIVCVLTEGLTFLNIFSLTQSHTFWFISSSWYIQCLSCFPCFLSVRWSWLLKKSFLYFHVDSAVDHTSIKYIYRPYPVSRGLKSTYPEHTACHGSTAALWVYIQINLWPSNPYLFSSMHQVKISHLFTIFDIFIAFTTR